MNLILNPSCLLSTTLRYEEFVDRKRVVAKEAGFNVNRDSLNSNLFEWQKDIVQWSLRLGKAAIFASCGLGKTIQQLEWAAHIYRLTGRNVLILAPLAVGHQTAHEAQRFGIQAPVKLAASQDGVQPGITITNYERVERFARNSFGGVVLDESSILKSFMGKTKRLLLDLFKETPYRLCCTATPSPNDHLELGNHAEFLGVMRSREMISRWFINDTMHAGNYRLKGHAAKDFWAWVASWAVSISNPSDLGYSDDGFVLPAMQIHEYLVEVPDLQAPANFLFAMGNLSATGVHAEKRSTAELRAKKVAELVSQKGGTWVLWCDTNYEADALKRCIPAAVEIRGSDPISKKERFLIRFTDQLDEVLITKPEIAGFGLNWQHCHQMAFVGLSYSFERFYQAVRRCWRFGQKCPVEVHVIASDAELSINRNIALKSKRHEHMHSEMSSSVRESQLENLYGRKQREPSPVPVRHAGNNWELWHGDCVEVLRTLPSESIDFCIHSPPFVGLYIYSNALADMGNCQSEEEFFTHYGYCIQELHRLTVPGRLCAVHCKDLPLYRGRDGAAGLVDFPGKIIKAFEDRDWTYHSRVTIWKNPVTEMQRTKNHGLLHKQLCKDSSASRQGMADFLLVFRKWTEDGSFPNPVHGESPLVRFNAYHGNNAPEGGLTPRERSIEIWQRYASPVWFDIDQMDVLNFRPGRDQDDEKHICPLQLGVIERSLDLWTNSGDLVLSPFAGVGSEGYVALKMGRRFTGVELKESYINTALKNLAVIEQEMSAKSLF